MRKRIATAIFVSVLFIVSLTGCVRTEKDEIADSLNNLQDTATDMDANETVTDLGIYEHLSYSFKAEKGETVNVEADVINTGFENASIYEAKVIEIDEALITEYADRLFDESKYEVIKPYFMFSMQELEDQHELVFEYMNENKIDLIPANLSDAISEISNYIGKNDESYVAELEEGQLIYKQDAVHMKTYSINFDTENVTYYSARLVGLIDGDKWELFYEAIDGSEPQQSIKIYSYESIVPNHSAIASMTDESVEQYGKNYTDLETSQEAAEAMIKRLGYENMEVINTVQLVFDDSNKSWTDGYKFVFAKSMDTMQIGYKDNSVEMLGDRNEEGYQFGVQQEYIHVYVVDNSVYSLTIDNIIELGDMLSDDGQDILMSFDEIDSIARELMEDTWDNSGPLNIDSVCLKYLVLPFEDGKYKLMPAWIYYYGDEDKSIGVRNSYICINAVDGSVIHSSGTSKRVTGQIIN